MNKKTIQRQLELAGLTKPINESNETKVISSVELMKEAANGVIYAIVRENRNYQIKTSSKKANLSESDFDYIGGVQNMTKYRYSSYESALRNLNFMFEEINELNGFDGNVDLFTNDVISEACEQYNEGCGDYMEEDDLQFLEDEIEEQKFKLKMPKSAPAPAPEPAPEEPAADDFDFSAVDDTEEPATDDFDFSAVDDTEEPPMGDLGGEGGDQERDGDDPIKGIQKLTGKLGQKIRDTEDVSSDMQKWVIKSVLSALELDEMSDEDKEDIINTIEDVEGEGGEEEFGGEETPQPKSKEGGKEEEPEFDFDAQDLGLEESVKRQTIKEHHIPQDDFPTYEQFMAYRDLEDMAKRENYTIEWCHKESDEEDLEESLVFLNIVNDGNNIGKARINSVGDIEIGVMEGDKFVGEPVDSASDFDEALEEEPIEDMEDYYMNNPTREKTKTPTKTPAKPGRRRDRKFRPGTAPKPGPKGGTKVNEDDVEFF